MLILPLLSSPLPHQPHSSWGLILPPQILRDCFSHRHSEIGNFSLPSLFSSSRNDQQMCRLWQWVLTLCPLVPGVSCLLLLAEPSLGCETGARCDLAQSKICCCFSSGDSTRVKTRGAHPPWHRVPTCPSLLEASLSKPSSRGPVSPTKKVLKSTFHQHGLSCVLPVSPFAAGMTAAQLQPCHRSSRQELVAAAAAS